MNSNLNSPLLYFVKSYLRQQSKTTIGISALNIINDALQNRITNCCIPIDTSSNNIFVRSVIDLLRPMTARGDKLRIQVVKNTIQKYIDCCKVIN